MEATHKLPKLEIHFNPEGWGPINGEKIAKFGNVPYLHFDKKDKISRPADFVSQNPSNNFNNRNTYIRRRIAEDGIGGDYFARHEANEEKSFQLVDTTKGQQRHKHTAKRQNAKPQTRNNRGGKTGQQDFSQAAKSKIDALRTKYGRNGGKKQDRKLDRTASVAVGPDWSLVEEFDLAQLLKLVANPPAVEDLLWCGFVDQYDDNYDRLTTKTSRGLKRCENKLFYDVTTTDDPILERFAVDGLGEVIATDSIIAQLMAAPRSVYSWDIVVQKLNGIIFLDKRENSAFDFLTVSETALEPPNSEADEINQPDKLAIEATLINQNFGQQILLNETEENRKTFEPNPFFDEAQPSVEPASIAYRYRKFTLGNIRLVLRTELHGWIEKHNEAVFMNSFALNEWDSRFSGGVNWRQKIDSQRGAVLATEVKNNSCKVAKWTAQSLLSGAGQMKIGYVSRVGAANNEVHTILATQFFKPKDLAQQINLQINNVWGIVKMICELLLNKPDGKYVLLKDPMKPIIRIYSTPLNTFEDDEEDEEGEEGDEGRDDGNDIANA